MTLSTLTSRVTYPGAGSVGPFAFPFRILSDDDLRVVRRSSSGVETVLTKGTHYTVAGVLDVSGTITLVTALAVGETLTIRRVPANTQPMSIRNQGTYYPATIEDEFDRMAMQILALQDLADRAVKLKESLTGSASLTELEPTAGKVVAGTGTGFTMSTLDSSATALPGGGRTVGTLSAYLANNAVYNAKDFGVVGGGVIDETAAIHYAKDQIPSGSILRFPLDKYKISNLVIDKRITLIGSGWWNSENGVFGSGVWNGSGNYGGTMFISTATTGIAVKFGSAAGSLNGYGLRDIMVLGPGSGTSIGVQFGHDSSAGAVEAVSERVLSANFATGWKLEFTQESEFRTCISRGCSTGFTLADESNNNTFTNYEIQFSTVDAILFTNSKGNDFYGGLLQNCINKGIRTATNSYGNRFYGPWLENAGAITDVVDFASGVNCAIFGGLVSKGNVKVGDAGCSIINLYSVALATLELTAGAASAVIINSKPSGAFTNNSSTAVVIADGEATLQTLYGAQVRLNSSFQRLNGRTNTVVTTAAVTINAGELVGTANPAHLTLVTGVKQGDGSVEFTDLVLWLGNNSPTVISSSILGVPAARTYSVTDAVTLKLQMASGTYKVTATELTSEVNV